MSTEVLLLNRSLQNLLSTETLGLHLGMFEIANNFLIPGPYAREKGQFARKVCLQLHPIMIRSTLRQISYTKFFNFFYVQYKASIVTFCKKNVSQIDSRPYYKWQLFGCRIILVNLWKIIWQVNDWPVFSLFKIRQIYLHAHDCSKCVISN